MKDSVLLDTSFFIRLMKKDDPIHQNAIGYFRYFLENDITPICSTISIAEYCVRGRYDELPWKNLKVIPFNFDHGIKAGEFARIVFEQRNGVSLSNRNIIPNDSKLFAQAALEESVKSFVTSDEECLKVFSLINNKLNPHFDIINIRTPYNETYGLINFGEG